MDLLLAIVIILVLLWVCGVGFAVGGSLIHLLLLLAAIILLVRLLQGRGI